MAHRLMATRASVKKMGRYKQGKRTMRLGGARKRR